MSTSNEILLNELKEKISEEILVSFYCQQAKADCKFQLLDCEVVFTQEAIYICGHPSKKDISNEVIQLKPFTVRSVELKENANQVFVLVNELYEFYIESYEEAKEILFRIGDELRIVPGKAKKDGFEEPGQLLFGFGIMFSSMNSVIGIFVHFAGWLSFIMYLCDEELSIVPILMIIGGLLIRYLGKIVGAGISGYGKLIMNSDAMLECMKRMENNNEK